MALSLPVWAGKRDRGSQTQKVAHLVTSLRAGPSDARRRGQLAELLHILYGVRRREVLGMGVADIASRGNRVRVLIRGDWLEVPPLAAPLVESHRERFVDEGGDRLSTGRGPTGILDPSSVAYYVRRFAYE